MNTEACTKKILAFLREISWPLLFIPTLITGDLTHHIFYPLLTSGNLITGLLAIFISWLCLAAFFQFTIGLVGLKDYLYYKALSYTGAFSMVFVLAGWLIFLFLVIDQSKTASLTIFYQYHKVLCYIWLTTLACLLSCMFYFWTKFEFNSSNQEEYLLLNHRKINQRERFSIFLFQTKYSRIITEDNQP